MGALMIPMATACLTQLTNVRRSLHRPHGPSITLDADLSTFAQKLQSRKLQETLSFGTSASFCDGL
jgi:hypothetical protein